MATGKVVQVKGPVVDVEFPDEHIPAIYHALEVDFGGEAAAHVVARVGLGVAIAAGSAALAAYLTIRWRLRRRARSPRR